MGTPLGKKTSGYIIGSRYPYRGSPYRHTSPAAMSGFRTLFHIRGLYDCAHLSKRPHDGEHQDSAYRRRNNC